MANKSTLIFGCLGLGLLVVAGLGGLGYWGWGMFVDHARVALDENPVIVQHIGAIEDMELDIEGTANAPGDDVFVFRLQGSRGDGVVTAEFVTVAEGDEIRSGVLELPSGETYDLLPGSPPSGAGGADR